MATGLAMALQFDADPTDDERRHQLFEGALHITSATPATMAFAAFARELIEQAFAGRDPERAQYEMPVDEYAAVLSSLKPRFIHHAESKRFLQQILVERGCDPELTYFDVPRLRSSTSDGYLTSGIAYAWHPHRDTWYSAPMAQLNMWMPVYAVRADNAMAIHPEYFDRAIANDSAKYNYYEWNAKHRASAGTNIGTESRPLPGPTEPVDLSSSVVPVTPVGGTLFFAGAQLHSSVPNTSGVTRFSIDYRTVHIGDIVSGRGAPNVDGHCTGSSIRDFIRVSDLSPVPDDIVSLFNDGSEAGGLLRYEPASRPTSA